MKLKAQLVFDAVPVISTIIREKRPLPQKGQYRIMRMHAKLLPDYTTLAERRDAMIRAYDTPFVPVNDPRASEPAPVGMFTVPPDKAAEFEAAWKEIGDEEIDISDLEPLPLSYLDLGEGRAGSVNALELITLGDLVKE